MAKATLQSIVAAAIPGQEVVVSIELCDASKLDETRAAQERTLALEPGVVPRFTYLVVGPEPLDEDERQDLDVILSAALKNLVRTHPHIDNPLISQGDRHEHPEEKAVRADPRGHGGLPLPDHPGHQVQGRGRIQGQAQDPQGS